MTGRRKPVPDCVGPGLRILFVGINPGRRSGEVGHHFAGPGNRFWRLLHEAGLTPVPLGAEDDRMLPAFGLGLTNLVDRPTAGERDLAWEELAAGGRRLRRLVRRLRPAVVCLLGKNVYRAYAGLGPSAPVAWGRQPRPVVPGTVDFVAPNPSGRNTLPYPRQLAAMRELGQLVAEVADPRPDAGRRFRLVVTDVEGCVVPADRRPWPLAQLAELAKWVARGEAGCGPRLLLCSGRPAQFVEAVAAALGVRLPAVCENGAVVLEPETGRTRPLYTAAEARLMARVRRACVRAYEETGLARVPAGRELGVALVPAPGRWPDVRAFRDHVEHTLRQAGLPPDRLLVTYSAGAVDVTPRGIDKASGVRRLLAELGVAPEEVFAIGDGANDLPLLAMAGGRGAPANALPEVRAVAQRVSRHPATLGVLELLRGLDGPGGPDPAGGP